jgi:hypothetical protein
MRRVKYTHANDTEQATIKCIQLKVEVEVEVIIGQKSLLTVKYHTLSGGLDRALRAARAFTAKLPEGTVSSETSTSSLRKKKDGVGGIVRIMEQEHLIEWKADRVMEDRQSDVSIKSAIIGVVSIDNKRGEE